LLVDRVGARAVLIAGLVIHGAALVAAGLAPSYPMLLVAFFLGGVGNAVFHPADFSILSNNVRESHLGRAFAVHTFCGGIGYASAPVVMGTLAVTLGWQGAMIAAGALGVVIGAAVLFAGGSLREDSARDRRAAGTSDADAEAKAGWRLMLTRPMILFFLFYVATSASGTGMTNFAAVALPAVYGMGPDVASALLTAFLVAAIAGALPGGWLADWSRREAQVLIICFLVMAACLFALGTGGLTFWMIAAMMVVSGFVRGLYNASRDVLVRRAAPPGGIGAAFGFVTLGYTLGQGGTPVIYGWLMDNGHAPSVFYLAAAAALLSIVTVIIPDGRKS
jgi:MFS family permease